MIRSPRSSGWKAAPAELLGALGVSWVAVLKDLDGSVYLVRAVHQDWSLIWVIWWAFMLLIFSGLLWSGLLLVDGPAAELQDSGVRD